MIETLARLESQPLGFRTSGVSVVEVNIPRGRWTDAASRQLLYERFVEKLMALPGVESAGISDQGPLSSRFGQSFSIEGEPEEKDDLAPKAGKQAVTPGYFGTFGIPMVTGRVFTEHDDERSAKVVIVNQTAARRWATTFPKP